MSDNSNFVDPFSVSTIGGDSLLTMADTSNIDHPHFQLQQQHQVTNNRPKLPSPPPGVARVVSPAPSHPTNGGGIPATLIAGTQSQIFQVPQQQHPHHQMAMMTPLPAVNGHQMMQQQQQQTPTNFGQQQLFQQQHHPPAPHNTPVAGPAPFPAGAMTMTMMPNTSNSSVGQQHQQSFMSTNSASTVATAASSGTSTATSSPTTAEKIESLRRQLAEAQRNAFWLQSEADSLRRAGGDQQRRIQQLEQERHSIGTDAAELRARNQTLTQQLEKTTAGAHSVVEQWRRRADECEESSRAKERRAEELAGRLEASEGRGRARPPNSRHPRRRCARCSAMWRACGPSWSSGAPAAPR
jgi:hypothetical protein